MIWVVTVWMLLTTGLAMETREFPSLASCEAYRLAANQAIFTLDSDRPSGTGVLIGACKPKASRVSMDWCAAQGPGCGAWRARN